MPALQVTLRPKIDREVPPGEISVEATFTNQSDRPARLNVGQASHPALALEVRDPKGERVLLPPPSAPDEEDLKPGAPIAPGQTVTLRYAGFLDRSVAPGNYEVRYRGAYEPLGGTTNDPLTSEWVRVNVRPAGDFPVGVPLRPPPPPPWPRWLARIIVFWRRIICFILRLLGLVRCDRVLQQEVDVARTETISNAPPEAAAWNGTYSWRARFHARVEEAACRVVATVRVRLVGTITAAQRTARETAIRNAWSGRFKLCTDSCCCTSGEMIETAIQFVTSGEHQVVNVGASTTNMGNWGASDTIDVRHEYGHMLGALDEYFTVNSVNWGAGRQPTGTIMNNPANDPVERHYDLIRDTVATLLGQPCTTRAAAAAC